MTKQPATKVTFGSQLSADAKRRGRDSERYSELKLMKLSHVLRTTEVSAKKRRILFLINDIGFFLSHRLPIAIAAKKSGYDVHVAAIDDCLSQVVRKHGFEFHGVPLTRNGTHLLREAKAICSIYLLFRRLRPDLVHSVTIKPVLYGALAARVARVPAVVAAVSGLGPAFSDNKSGFSLVRAVVKLLYKAALSHRNMKVIFQNGRDRDIVLSLTRIDPDKTTLIRGSGVDLTEFDPIKDNEGERAVLMASRLLKSKGVEVFVEAAKRVRSADGSIRFLLAGAPDAGNASAIDQQTLEKWRNEDFVELLGHRSDMAKLMGEVQVVVLPSTYGEGLPKVLIEAAASGRAVVTTDHPGCRDAIIPGKTGVLIAPNDIEALVSAINELMANPDLRKEMGKEGRRLAEREFSIENVISEHLAIYEQLLQTVAPTFKA